MANWAVKPVNKTIAAGLMQSGDGSKTNTVWRFYTIENHRWKWQRLSVSHAVIEESRSEYKDYETCLANAKQKGYVFQPSQARTSLNVTYRSFAK